jgi:predicted ATPase
MKMKEGYFQIKITEINEKCKKIEQMISMEKSKIELLEEKVGGFKNLIKKLQEYDNFKDIISKQIKKQNQIIIKQEIQDLSKEMADCLDRLIKNKTDDIEKIAKYQRRREKKVDGQMEIISNSVNKINYLMKFNELLMMKLVNKAILSDREVNELDMRSKKV